MSECTDSKIRGVIGSFPSLSMSAGILCSYILGDLMAWTRLAWTSAFVSSKSICTKTARHYIDHAYVYFIVLLMVTIMFLPESPVWLASKNKLVEAQRAREWLKLEKCGTSNTEKAESQQTTVDITSDDESQSWKVIFTRPILMPMLIGLTLLLIQQVSGIDAVIFFTVDIFRSSGKLLANKWLALSQYVQFLFIFLRQFNWRQFGYDYRWICAAGKQHNVSIRGGSVWSEATAHSVGEHYVRINGFHGSGFPSELDWKSRLWIRSVG